VIRVFLRICSKNREPLLQPRTPPPMPLQTQLLQRLVVVWKGVRSQLIFLRLRHNEEDLVVLLVEAVIFSDLGALGPELGPEPELVLVD
jgi:hypothetical protein